MRDVYQAPVAYDSKVDLPIAEGSLDEAFVPSLALRNLDAGGLVLIVVFESVCNECPFLRGQKGRGFGIVVKQEICCESDNHGYQAF